MDIIWVREWSEFKPEFILTITWPRNCIFRVRTPVRCIESAIQFRVAKRGTRDDFDIGLTIRPNATFYPKIYRFAPENAIDNHQAGTHSCRVNADASREIEDMVMRLNEFVKSVVDASKNDAKYASGWCAGTVECFPSLPTGQERLDVLEVCPAEGQPSDVSVKRFRTVPQNVLTGNRGYD
jgi:hypothetical protein